VTIDNALLTKPNQRRVLPVVCATALAAAFTLALAHPAHAERVTPPRVPKDVQVPDGNKAFLEGHATGTQNYVCLPSGSSVAWVFFAPQATLFTDDSKQIITHFLSPNPFEAGAARATWQHSRDSSVVWGSTIGTSSDSRFVKPGAIPWLLLVHVGNQDGPTGGDTLTGTTYIQRLNTVGGSAPAIGCAVPTDVGKKVLVPYKADYFFYKYDNGDYNNY
jgi:hypothetical protein